MTFTVTIFQFFLETNVRLKNVYMKSPCTNKNVFDLIPIELNCCYIKINLTEMVLDCFHSIYPEFLGVVKNLIRVSSKLI